MLVIAHRGYSGKYPENTLVAFQEAIKLKAPAIELDIHLSKDNELVVTHDFDLGRCVQGSGTVNTHSLSDLTQMNAGSFKGAEFKNEKVPSLESVLSMINHQCLLNIEIKKETLISPIAYNTMADKVLMALKDYGLKDILFSSFDHYFLKMLRLKSKEARIAMLDDRVDQGPKLREAKDLLAEAYNVNLKRLSIENVHFIKAAGFKVFAYTVKNKADLALAQGLQVDAIFADNLEECLAHLGT